MQRITIECPKKRPRRVCDFIREESGKLIMEFKLPGEPILQVDISQHLEKLGYAALN